MNKLQLLRDHCGFPFYLNSARRCKYWNDKSGGYPTSAHLDGLATDIRVTDKVLLRVILKHAIDMGFEGIGVADDFIHLDSKKEKWQSILALFITILLASPNWSRGN